MTVAAGATTEAQGQQQQPPVAATTADPKPSREGLRAVAEQAAAAPAAQQQQTNGQQAGIGHNQGPEWMPEGVPEAMRGKDAKETIGKLAAALPQVPKAPADYKLELSGEAARLAGDLAADPVLPIAQKVAHKAGLTNAQFSGMVGELYAELHKQGMLTPLVDTAAEFEKLKPRAGTPAERLVAAEKRLLAAQGMVNRFRDGGILTKTEANNLMAITVVADGITAIEKLGKLLLTEDGVRAGGVATNGQGVNTAEQQLRAMYPTTYKSAS